MNIIELNQNEVSAVSGGVIAEFGAFAGQAFGVAAVAFGYTLYKAGISKRIDNFGELSNFAKVTAVASIAFSPKNLRFVWRPVCMVMGGNLLFSIVGGIVDRYFYGNKG